MKYVFLLLFVSSQIFALSKSQVKTIEIAYNIGKQIKTKDNMSFEKALSGIVLQESSAGRELRGDKYKNGKLKSLHDSSLGIFQIKLSTAKWIIKHNKFMNKYFKYMLKDDKILVNMLFTNKTFSALTAGKYLKTMYEEAKRKKLSDPWMRAISRYNGGWNNMTYFKKVMKRIHYLEKRHFFERQHNEK